MSLSGTPRSLRLKLVMAVVGALCLLLVFSAGISYGVSSGNGDGDELTIGTDPTSGTEESPSVSTGDTTAQPSE